MSVAGKGSSVQDFFRVDGADLETGEEAYLILQAASIEDAEQIARKQGLLISSVRPANSADWGAPTMVGASPPRVFVNDIVFEPLHGSAPPVISATTAALPLLPPDVIVAPPTAEAVLEQAQPALLSPTARSAVFSKADVIEAAPPGVSPQAEVEGLTAGASPPVVNENSTFETASVATLELHAPLAEAPPTSDPTPQVIPEAPDVPAIDPSAAAEGLQNQTLVDSPLSYPDTVTAPFAPLDPPPAAADHAPTAAFEPMHAAEAVHSEPELPLTDPTPQHTAVTRDLERVVQFGQAADAQPEAFPEVLSPPPVLELTASPAALAPPESLEGDVTTPRIADPPPLPPTTIPEELAVPQAASQASTGEAALPAQAAEPDVFLPPEEVAEAPLAPGQAPPAPSKEQFAVFADQPLSAAVATWAAAQPPVEDANSPIREAPTKSEDLVTVTTEHEAEADATRGHRPPVAGPKDAEKVPSPSEPPAASAPPSRKPGVMRPIKVSALPVRPPPTRPGISPVSASPRRLPGSGGPPASPPTAPQRPLPSVRPAPGAPKPMARTTPMGRTGDDGSAGRPPVIPPAGGAKGTPPTRPHAAPSLARRPLKGIPPQRKVPLGNEPPTKVARPPSRPAEGPSGKVLPLPPLLPAIESPAAPPTVVEEVSIPPVPTEARPAETTDAATTAGPAAPAVVPLDALPHVAPPSDSPPSPAAEAAPPGLPMPAVAPPQSADVSADEADATVASTFASSEALAADLFVPDVDGPAADTTTKPAPQAQPDAAAVTAARPIATPRRSAGPSLFTIIFAPFAFLVSCAGLGVIVWGVLRIAPTDPVSLELLDQRLQALTLIVLGAVLLLIGLVFFVGMGLARVANAVKAQKPAEQ